MGVDYVANSVRCAPYTVQKHQATVPLVLVISMACCSGLTDACDPAVPFRALCRDDASGDEYS